MPKITLSVIIPAYNEEKRLPQTLTAVADFLSRQKYTSELIVVDDGSADNTGNIKLPSASPPLLKAQMLHHQENIGKGVATKTGVATAQGEFILLTDADNSTPIEELEKLWPAITHTDIAIGSRHLPDSVVRIRQPWHRRIISYCGNKFIQLTLLRGIADTQCGFKLFRANAAKEIFSLATINRWGFDIEALVIAQKLGYKITEIPVVWLDSPFSRFRPLNDAAATFKELISINLNAIRGKYRR